MRTPAPAVPNSLYLEAKEYEENPLHRLQGHPGILYLFPEETKVLMGHTRMTTQGSEKQNRNNLEKLRTPLSPQSTTVCPAMTAPFSGPAAYLGVRCRPTPMWPVQLPEEAREISHVSLTAWRRSWYPLSGGWSRELRAPAGDFGYSGEDATRLESEGYTPEEIEDWLYGARLP